MEYKLKIVCTLNYDKWFITKSPLSSKIPNVIPYNYPLTPTRAKHLMKSRKWKWKSPSKCTFPTPQPPRLRSTGTSETPTEAPEPRSPGTPQPRSPVALELRFTGCIQEQLTSDRNKAPQVSREYALVMNNKTWGWVEGWVGRNDRIGRLAVLEGWLDWKAAKIARLAGLEDWKDWKAGRIIKLAGLWGWQDYKAGRIWRRAELEEVGLEDPEGVEY